MEEFVLQRSMLLRVPLYIFDQSTQVLLFVVPWVFVIDITENLLKKIGTRTVRR